MCLHATTNCAIPKHSVLQEKLETSTQAQEDAMKECLRSEQDLLNESVQKKLEEGKTRIENEIKEHLMARNFVVILLGWYLPLFALVDSYAAVSVNIDSYSPTEMFNEMLFGIYAEDLYLIYYSTWPKHL